MNILVLNAHWNNRGDEAAIRAMIDEVRRLYPSSKFKIQLLSGDLKQYPYKGAIENIEIYPKKKDILAIPFVLLSKGKISISKNTKNFINAVKEADIVIHAPGGPSIGEIYSKAEISYLLRLSIVRWLKKPLFFYAPSMGPFKNKFRNKIRKKILNYSIFLCTREEISSEYISKLDINKKVVVTLDSAIQNTIDKEDNNKKLTQYEELNKFISSGKKVIGLTVTNLMWNPKYKDNNDLEEKINTTFRSFIEFLVNKGYRVLFIPQLFGEQNDYEYMKSFITGVNRDNVMVMSDKYDCYFQQYIISLLYSVVGMRYHSNIFSAKMKVPFISISYEQKMKGFMEKTKLANYCINVEELDLDKLINLFENIEIEHDKYKEQLEKISKNIIMESGKTTQYLLQCMKDIESYK